ncbi:MAG: helix-turn-helix domain-containing protein [Bdellovibrionales bacterium]
MKLSGLQIAAAITLSGLTREALANEAGVGRNTIDRIINETAACREDTIRKITDILEVRGIEFLPGEGVRKKEQTVTTLTGDDCLQELLLDVYRTLQDKGGEMLIAHLDEGSAARSLKKEFLDEQIRKRKVANITCRLLVRADDPNLIPPYNTYRAIPDESFSPYPFYIYGSKLALLSWQPEPRVIIIDDQRFAQSATKLFNIAWNTGKEIVRNERK